MVSQKVLIFCAIFCVGVGVGVWGEEIGEELLPNPSPAKLPSGKNHTRLFYKNHGVGNVGVGRNCNMFARKASCLCKMNFKPLCANGVTFANWCQFQCAQRCEPSLRFGWCGSCWQKNGQVVNALNTSRSCMTP